MNFKDQLTYILLKLISKKSRNISEINRRKLAIKLAAFVYNFVPIRKKEAFNNIKTAFPEMNHHWINKQLKGTYQIVINNFIDFLSLPNSYQKIKYKIENQDIFDKAIKKEKGLILLTAHFGLWEKWGAWIGMNNYPIWGVIQKQANKGADLFFKEIRESYGMNHIYRKSSINKIYELIKKKKIVILASDQDARKNGVRVNFFNKPTYTPKGAAKFHIKTDVPMVFSVSYMEPDGTIVISFSEIKIKSNLSVENISQIYTNNLEKIIKRYPDHYFWFHRKWKSTNIYEH